MKIFLEPIRELKAFRKKKMEHASLVKSITADFSKTMQA